MQPSKPALEATMEKVPTATMTVPWVLWEGDPDTAEHQHAEGQELGFTEGVRQVPGQESQGEAPQG